MGGDGVTYHSSPSARDRDRIRQEILESLGWRGRIIRVWSTDWFADPAGQTARLVKFLKERLRQDDASPPPFSDEDLQEHEAEAAEASGMPEPHLEQAKSKSAVAKESEPVQPTTLLSAEPALFVELGDRVTYQIATEPPQRHTVQIVDSPSNLKLGLLNDGTPLAQTLLGLCEGDEAELRIKDQPARALRIIRVERQSAAVNDQ
ncbi:hypothetical protein OOT46_25555 [Aquabacterium sp. A7-Y]|uniref:GreA/GreB family elongation factor n=1 Tax=Aquabacterium sp. A7-Y TaxID=1349605 RepID=UPI00223DD3CB|nr:GreA/GreB family elongation factor [Aquabacterium sp. A7-Y]MCW7541182.1 hypothetical protein [Aquabacterium sp. A7-Y]